MKKIILLLLLLILATGVFLVWYIYSASEHVPPHFHANFAMYIDGEKIDFSGDQYMEDVAGCSITGDIMPKDRVHLHENNPDTIHVHAAGVSWGHFFANNNITFWEKYLVLDNWTVYKNNDSSSIKYIINWKIKTNPFNKFIWSKDRLLIAYGNKTDEELLILYETVSDNAGEYNEKYDPGSCGGTNENGILVILREFVQSFHHSGH